MAIPITHGQQVGMCQKGRTLSATRHFCTTNEKELATLHPDLVYYTQHIWLPGLASRGKSTYSAYNLRHQPFLDCGNATYST